MTVQTVRMRIQSMLATLRDRVVALWKSGSAGKVVCVGAVLFFVWLVWPSATTVEDTAVEEVRREFVSKFNRQVADRSCPLWKRIEDAHITVTVYRANVLSCDVITNDGSDKAGAFRSNIKEVAVVVRLCWDGIIQQGGTTDVEFILTPDGKCTRTRIVRTDALFNVEDPEFWYEVGFGLGLLLL